MSIIPPRSEENCCRVASNILFVLRKAQKEQDAQKSKLPFPARVAALKLSPADSEHPEMRTLQEWCVPFVSKFQGGIFRRTKAEFSHELLHELTVFLRSMAEIEATGYADKASTDWYRALRALPALGDLAAHAYAFMEAAPSRAACEPTALVEQAHQGLWLHRTAGPLTIMRDPSNRFHEVQLHCSLEGKRVWKPLLCPVNLWPGRALESIGDEARWFNQVLADVDASAAKYCEVVKEELLPELRWIDTYARKLVDEATPEQRNVLRPSYPR